MAVTERRIPSTDPRLARHVRHDDRSWNYRFNTEGLSIISVGHPRHIPILDQGQVGSCTGNAGIGCMASDPFYSTVAGAGGRELTRRGTPQAVRYSLDEAGAVHLYSDAETIDGDGPYPPNDFGSSGLSVAQALKNAGEIAGYQHTFSADDALKALSVTPVLFGTNWYDGMFSPDPDGRIRISGSLAGGHELVIREVDAANQRVWLDNSWGDGWGVNGRGYLTFADFDTLLGQQGDITVLVPLTQPAPTPTPPAPPADPDAALAAVAHRWVAYHHTSIAENKHMQQALKTWLQAKGL